MSLEEKNPENMHTMIEDIKSKLDMVNDHMLSSENYNIEQYDDIMEIYKMVQHKKSVSIMEKQAILQELGDLRSTDD